MKARNIPDNPGWKEVLIESDDDLWYIRTIISQGDFLRTTVMRREEKKGDMERSKEQKRTPTSVTIKIEEVSFQPFTGRLRISGQIVESSAEIKGSFQSVNISPIQEIELFKENWSIASERLISEAQLKWMGNDLLFIVLDDEQCDIYTIKAYGIENHGKIFSGKSGKGYESQKSPTSYYSEIENTIKPFSSVKVIVAAGPGFERENFVEFLKKSERFSAIKILSVPTTRNDENAVYEVLTDSSIASFGNISRLKTEKEKVEKLLEEISKNRNATYGHNNVMKAVEIGAVEELLISESEFRKNSSQELLELAMGSGVKVEVFSDESEHGKIVKGLGGICALLRYNPGMNL
ncbi:MAG: mRNA surveillance protein pelota [Thermoplasmataceae archaeon]